jgi:hypothetical protein
VMHVLVAETPHDAGGVAASGDAAVSAVTATAPRRHPVRRPPDRSCA